MKFCQTHWNQLKDAIESKGMYHLVAASGELAVDRLKEELDGTATKLTYDPLMNSHNMINLRALECCGLYLLTGDYCPLCEFEKSGGVRAKEIWYYVAGVLRKKCLVI